MKKHKPFFLFLLRNRYTHFYYLYKSLSINTRINLKHCITSKSQVDCEHYFPNAKVKYND